VQQHSYRAIRVLFAGLALICYVALNAEAQTSAHYEATEESLNRHPLPAWYDDAKLGIFIHWGLYSVPGWAPVSHPEHDFANQDYIRDNPYAEWYYNSMRIEGSPTQKYHAEKYGADYNYYQFATTFNREIQKWDADAWAKLIKDTGARYVVLTTKHHDGFTLWPSSTPNPSLPADRQHASRDLVGDLATAMRKQGLRMGLYYSGGYDWTFVPGPIRVAADYQKVKPQSEAYGKYADAHVRELITRYKPSLLWNDIDYPKSGHALELMAEYYAAVPDGVIDDRFGVDHSDFTTPEYQTLGKINRKKWEECRGLGRSFGYNRAEGEAETIPPADLIHLLVDIVSKNGNLLLDIGPEADGTIPAVQLERLSILGKWLAQNGEAIYGTHPWNRAEGETTEGIPVRFTSKGSDVYAILLGSPKSTSLTLKSVHPENNAKIHLLGRTQPLAWKQDGEDIQIDLRAVSLGDYAIAFRLAGLTKE
jgi:alpha-L-fucosidase